MPELSDVRRLAEKTQQEDEGEQAAIGRFDAYRTLAVRH